jgi:ParB/Sulfiredoxin domain
MQEVMIMADEDEMLELAKVPPELWVKVEEAGGTMLTERLHEGKPAHRTYRISRAGLRTVLESVTRVAVDDYSPSLPPPEPSWAGVLPTREISIGSRRRRELGDIDSLAESMREHELIHPIVVDDQNQLVAGFRRLEAAKRLGWDKIRVRRYKELSAKRRLAIELEENLQRKDLTPYEQSKAAVDLEDLAREVERGEFRGESPRKWGRPQSGRRSAARRIGISEKTLRDAERHVQLADRSPFMKARQWRQAHVVEVGEALDKLPRSERDDALGMIEEFAPEKALQILRNLSLTSGELRAEIYRSRRSENEGERAEALTRAERGVDARITLLQEALSLLRGAVREAHEAPEAAEITELAERVDAILRKLSLQSKVVASTTLSSDERVEQPA